MNDPANHLKALGLDPHSKLSADDIKSAWRKKANEHHPDRGGDQEKFIAITHAYKMLTDPSYRNSESKRKTPDTPDLNFRVQMPVTFEDAFFGRKVSMCFNRLEITSDFKPVVKEEHEMIYVDMDLPQGCQSGHEIKRDSLGLKCGDEYGNLVVKIIPQRHVRFQLSGANIVVEESFPLNILLKGGEVEVQTMYGIKTLKVPPGTAPGSELTIPKCGVGKFGDHLVIVKQLFPNKQELKQEEWKGLKINWSTTPKENPDDELEKTFTKLRGGFIEEGL